MRVHVRPPLPASLSPLRRCCYLEESERHGLLTRRRLWVSPFHPPFTSGLGHVDHGIYLRSWAVWGQILAGRLLGTSSVCRAPIKDHSRRNKGVRNKGKPAKGTGDVSSSQPDTAVDGSNGTERGNRSNSECRQRSPRMIRYMACKASANRVEAYTKLYLGAPTATRPVTIATPRIKTISKVSPARNEKTATSKQEIILLNIQSLLPLPQMKFKAHKGRRHLIPEPPGQIGVER